MRSLFIKTVVWMLFAILFVMACACCDETESAASTGASDASVVNSMLPSITMGLETYVGGSSMLGARSYTDGMWAGCGNYYPSIAYMEYGSSGGRVAKLSLGIGELYTADDTTLDQPVEAYFQTPVGKSVVTVGKYWVPFAQQEWLYESKPGIMVGWDVKRLSLTASANYSEGLRRPVMYLRSGYKLSEDVQLGLSLALGRGFCSDSIHDRGMGLDATIGYKGWRFYGECNHFAAREPGNDFDYVSGKLCYEKLGRWAPFVGAYSWTDKSDTFGRFRSTVYGLAYHATPELDIESAVAPTSDGSVSWLQVRWSWQKSFPPRWSW